MLRTPGFALGAARWLTRAHARRLREVYRSAGWPCQDGIEIELLAAGLLERVRESVTGERVDGPAVQERVRVTDAGLQVLALALQRNRQALSAHEALVARVGQWLLDAGRVVWTGLSIRARLSPHNLGVDPTAAARGGTRGVHAGNGGDGARIEPADIDPARVDQARFNAAAMDPASMAPAQFDLVPGAPAAKARWRICKPDVFSIRNTSVGAYLQPVVHEIKVSRADLLGDLRLADKRDSYLDIAGQCWYVLGMDARGRPIAQAGEVPSRCGVIHATADGRFDVLRHAPVRPMPDLPFALWMALAKATPLTACEDELGTGPAGQARLREPGGCGE